MNSELLSRINQVYDLCDELDGLGYGVGYGYKQRDALKAELVVFILYFSMKNGGITEENSAFLKDCLGIDMPVELMNNMYKTMVVDNLAYQDADFASKVSACVLSFLNADNQIYASSNDDTKSVAAFTAKLYEALGEELFESDKSVDKDAYDKFTSFVKLNIDYINDNLAYNL